MKNDILISVIIPTIRPREILKRCLDALHNQNLGLSAFEVIAVNDDKKRKLTKNQLSYRGHNLYILNSGGVGAGMARNRGISIAKGKIIYFVDDDCIPEKNNLSLIADFFKSNPKIAGVGGTILSYKPQSFTQKYISAKRLLGKPVQDKKGNITTLITANAAYRRKIIKNVGGFSEYFYQYKVAYGGEDIDLTFKIKGLGGKFAYLPNLVVFHEHRKSLKSFIKQHIAYGRGAYLFTRMRNVPPKIMKFPTPNLFNVFIYLFIITPLKMLRVDINEFYSRKVPLLYWLPFYFMDLIRKTSFMTGVLKMKKQLAA